MNKKKLVVLFIIVLAIIAIIFIIKANIDKSKRNYEIEKISEYNYFLMYENGKMGVIDKSGKTIIPPVYDSIQIPNPSKDVFVCLYDYNSQNEKYSSKVLNKNEEELFKNYDMVTALSLNGIASNIPFEKSVLLTKKDNKYGLINLEGKEVVKPEYDEIQCLTYKEGEFLVKKDNSYGVVNMNGYVIIKPKYNSVSADNYYNEECKYKKSGYIVSISNDSGYKYGYINYEGKEIIKPEYTSISRINEINDSNNVYLIVQDKTKVGLIKNKDIVIGVDYKELKYDKQNDVIIARKNAKSGIISLNGNVIIPIEYDELTVNGVYVYTNNNDVEKMFDIEGKTIEEGIYKGMTKVQNGKYYIAVDNDSLYELLDKNKNVLTNNKYTYLEYLFDDYFIANNNGLGIINADGEVVLDFSYDVLSKIDNTNIVQGGIISKNTIDLFSKELKKIGTYKNANISVHDDYIEVNSDDLNTLYLSFEGRKINTTEIYKNNTLFATQRNGKWGFIDKSGELIIDCIYDEVTEFNEYGYAGIKLDNKWGSLNTSGEVVEEPKYILTTKPFFINKYYRVYYGYGSVYYTCDN